MIKPSKRLKMGTPRTIDPNRVKQLIEEAEGDWSYPGLAKILSQEIGVVINADAVSKCARRNGIIRPKLAGRKKALLCQPQLATK